MQAAIGLLHYALFAEDNGLDVGANEGGDASVAGTKRPLVDDSDVAGGDVRRRRGDDALPLSNAELEEEVRAPKEHELRQT